MVAGRGYDTVIRSSSRGAACEVYGKRRPVRFAIPAVYLRYFCRKLRSIALRETTHDKKRVNAAIGFGLAPGEDLVNGFFLGIADESAGVYHDAFPSVGFKEGFGGGVDNLVAHIGEHHHQTLRIHKVFRTAKGDDCYFICHFKQSLI